MMKALLLTARFALLAYLCCCVLLYFFQRKLLYVPPHEILGEAPAQSSYKTLVVDVPEVGKITEWLAPATSPDKPTIVFFHGNGSDRSDFVRAGERFHQRGWGVLLASYPGYSGNPGAPSEKTLMASARATLDALGQPPGGIIVWGHSLGSGVAARMASERKLAGLVLEAPYTSITDVAAKSFPVFPARLILKDHFDTRSLVSVIKVPVLIIHAEGDPVIPFSMGKELAQRFGKQAVFDALYNLHSHFPHADRDLTETVDDWWQTKVSAKHMFADTTSPAGDVVLSR